jgi:hypothetical protein
LNQLRETPVYDNGPDVSEGYAHENSKRLQGDTNFIFVMGPELRIAKATWHLIVGVNARLQVPPIIPAGSCLVRHVRLNKVQQS